MMLGFNLVDGFAAALTPENIALALIGCLLGTLIGVLPGIGPITGVAILFPITLSLGLDDASTLILLASVYYGSQYGGSTTSILLNVPGEASSVVTTLDGYQMARQGRAGQALAIAAIGSFIAGTGSVIGLMAFGPPLSEVTTEFQSPEKFMVVVLAFATVSSLAGSNLFKGLLAVVFGIMLSTVGIDLQTGVPRYTFGELKLQEGMDFVVIAIGLFAVSEVLTLLEDSLRGENVVFQKAERIWVTFREFTFSLGAIIRGSVIGFFVGLLPGTGASVAGFMSYGLEKRISDRDKTFGHGDIRGVAAPESANNAAAGGSLVPLLTLGIPGSGTTAVMLGILISMGIRPGSGNVFAESPDLIWTLIASMYIGNLMLLLLNFPMVKMFVKILEIPPWFLMPMILVISYIGVYSVNNSSLDITLMTIFGLVGFLLRKLDVPLAPILMGLILGDDLEQNFRRSLVAAQGDYTTFVDGWLNIGLVVASIVVLFLPQILSRARGKNVKDEFADAGAEV
ncbi:MAG: tripartite tricarboxylate transporter permease [Actinomycetia bacterium]|nr:tripartite tricarboxylate transporter permease [Actinomycetes bacterium]